MRKPKTTVEWSTSATAEEWKSAHSRSGEQVSALEPSAQAEPAQRSHLAEIRLAAMLGLFFLLLVALWLGPLRQRQPGPLVVEATLPAPVEVATPKVPVRLPPPQAGADQEPFIAFAPEFADLHALIKSGDDGYQDTISTRVIRLRQKLALVEIVTWSTGESQSYRYHRFYRLHDEEWRRSWRRVPDIASSARRCCASPPTQSSRVQRSSMVFSRD